MIDLWCVYTHLYVWEVLGQHLSLLSLFNSICIYKSKWMLILCSTYATIMTAIPAIPYIAIRIISHIIDLQNQIRTRLKKQKTRNKHQQHMPTHSKDGKEDDLPVRWWPHGHWRRWWGWTAWSEAFHFTTELTMTSPVLQEVSNPIHKFCGDHLSTNLLEFL